MHFTDGRRGDPYLGGIGIHWCCIMRSPLFLAILFAAPLAHAGTTSLGLDSSLNLLALGDFTGSGSDVQGRVAVAGNASISSYSIDTKSGGSALYAGTGLTVGGNLNFGSGSVWGDTRVGGNATTSYSGSFDGSLYVKGVLNEAAGLWLSAGNSATSWGGVTNKGEWMPSVQAGTGSFNLGFDFNTERTQLTSLSTQLAQDAATGTVTNPWGSTLYLNASGARVAVFNLSAAQAAMNMELDNLAADATAIINIAGSNVDFGNHGYANFAAAAGRVLFNLAGATNITLNGGIDASLLAPLATVGAGYGVINGQVVVNNWYSSVQVNDSPFTGGLPVLASAAADSSKKVPEPGTWGLLLAGLGMLAACRRSLL